ncbi:MAG: HEAT repeat domain-containing protein [Planctomycetes bacterium]|nr:HEAT repeat domain-containing protein [Planctomycetota bacterium]
MPAAGAGAASPQPSGGTTQPPRTVITGRGRGRTQSVSLEDWEAWWRFNRDAFLVRRKYLPTRQQNSRDTDVFLGRSVPGTPPRALPPDWTALRHQIVPALRSALEDSSPTVRAAACTALGKVGFDEDVPALGARLADTSAFVREAATLGLGLIGQEAGRPALLAVLKADHKGQQLRGGRPPEIQMRAVAALALGLLGRDPDGEVTECLELLSTHPTASPDMALLATVALGLVEGDRRAVSRVAWHLKDLATRQRGVNDWIQAQAVTALQRIHERNRFSADDRTLSGLARLASEARIAHVRRSAVVALGALVHTPEHEAVAAQELADLRDSGKDSHTRNLAAVALGRIGGEAAYRALVAGLEESGQSVHRVYCALGLALLLRGLQDRAAPEAPRDLTPGFIHLRRAFDESRDLSSRSGLALALGIARDRDSGARLLQELKRSSEPTQRGHLALALGMVGHEPAVPELTALLLETKYPPFLKEQIATGLGILGRKNLVALLERLERSRSAQDLDAVLRAVALVGDQSAVKPLAALAVDPRAQIQTRAAACRALGVLGDPHPIPVLAALRADHNYLAASAAVNAILFRDL